jgi:hypothetical protein
MTAQATVDELFRDGVPYAQSLHSRLATAFTAFNASASLISIYLRDDAPYALNLNARLALLFSNIGVSDADVADLFRNKAYQQSLYSRIRYAFTVAGPSIQFSANTVAEDATTNTVICALSVANHPSGSSGWTFAITSQTPSGKLNISSANLRTNAALDFETNPTLSVVITASKTAQTDIVSPATTIYVTNVLELPAAPTLVATAGNGQVTLSWTDNSFSGPTITSHNLYRGTTSGVLTLVTPGPGSAASPFVDTGLTNGTAYYYKLSAVNSDGESALSTERSATPSAVVTPTRFTVAANSWVANGAYWYDNFVTANPTITVGRVAGNGWALSDITTNIASIAAQDPHVVLIDEAINSLNTSMTAAQYLSDVQTLVAAIRAACPNLQKIGVAESPPSTSGTINTKRATVNPGLRALVGSTIDFIVPANMSDADASDPTYIDNASPPGHPATNAQAILLATRNAVIAPIFAGATATSPTAFTFTDIGGAPTSHAYTQFTTAPITGMVVGNGATGVLTNSGTWQLGRGGTANTSNKTVYNGDWPAINQTSSATFPPETAVNSTLTIGTRADTFTTTTGALATDTFTRADGALGTTETGSLSWVGPAAIVSNTAALGQQSKSFGLVNTGLTDVDFTFDVTIPGSGSPQPRLFFNGDLQGSPSTTSPSSYMSRFYIADLTGGQLLAHHESFGDFGGVGTFTALTAGTYTVRIVSKRSDSSILVYVGGSLVCTGTMRGDIFPSATGYYIGFGDEQASANAGILFDNFSVQAAA